MDMRIIVIALIILLAGMFGGIGACLADGRAHDPDKKRFAFPRFIVLGIIAAACVPLFLSLVQSGLVETIFVARADPAGQPQPPAYESYLIFVGLCLIAAFSSRRFIDSVSKQMIQRIEEVAGTAAQAQKAADDARNVAQKVDEAAGEAVDEPDAAPPSGPEPGLESLNVPDGDETVSPLAQITEEERRILQALTKRTYRTRTGIAEDSGISRNRISEFLDDLKQRKLAQPTHSPSTGGLRWIITKRGRAALDGKS